jgi:hypothetical protein
MQLGFLRPLYAGEGRYASIYLDASPTADDTADLLALRWQAARDKLAEQGADTATLDALDGVVIGPARAEPGLAAFARSGEVIFSARLPHPPRREISRYARLPHLMPLLAQYLPQVTQLRVAADRAGGEIMAVRAADVIAKERIEGIGWPVHKAKIGGWSQARYQRSAEEAWEENAKQLAAAVTAEARRAGTDLIVIGGDVRARMLLLEHLGKPLRDGTVVVDREVPVDSDLMAEAAEQAARARTEQEARRRLESFRNQLPHGTATEGLAETMAALGDGLASDVLVADDPTSTATAWIGPEPADLATSEAALRERGIAQITTDRADAAIVRAVACTGAELWFVPEEENEPPPRAGVGALLRYTVPQS